MHRFHICEGSVTYSSRFLRSDSYNLNSEKNRIVVSEFGTVAMPDPCKNFFARFFSRFQIPRMYDFFIYCIILFETCSTKSECFSIIPTPRSLMHYWSSGLWHRWCWKGFLLISVQSKPWRKKHFLFLLKRVDTVRIHLKSQWSSFCCRTEQK